MASSSSMGTHWAAFRFPPVNLWIMPAWQRAGTVSTRCHTDHASRLRKLHRQYRELLVAREGRHVHQD
ncbi:MAG TPA: hypothetical protein VJ961_04115 [Mariprofundaceae bacterium]|nr:hypothetical protein [Mariprofundaceae bacterium]